MKIYIPEFRQFKNFALDLTYLSGPDEGKPLKKVCFIGKNGTGKTTLLANYINGILNNPFYQSDVSMFVKLRVDNNDYFFVNIKHLNSKYFYIVKETSNQIINIEETIVDMFSSISNNYNKYDAADIESFFNQNQIPSPDVQNIYNRLNSRKHKVLIYVPAEVEYNNAKSDSGLPTGSVDDALELTKGFEYSHIVSSSTINNFWKNLIFLIKKREANLIEFQQLEENQNKILKEVNYDFERNNPKILEVISVIWNEILGKAGLEFDIKNASIPVQLRDNLLAYIISKSTREIVHYSRLSTGIRNFIFTLGHIHTLYFGRKIEQGYLLIDEPENSLFPDLLYDMIEFYRAVTKNTQLFVATHSPIIAAQFEPNERMILDFDENDNVILRHGKSPIGDDANDLLTQDFGVRNLLGPEGIKKWERYIELKHLIIHSVDATEKNSYLKELIKIGNSYNFDGV